MKKVIVVFATVFLLIGGFMVWQRMTQPELCHSPWHPPFPDGKSNHPTAVTRRMIALLDGLPKESIDLDDTWNRLAAGEPVPIFPVKSWRIGKSWVTFDRNINSFWDDDPVYGRDFILYITYEDGDTAVFQSSSWSYGYVLCPVILSVGNGPLGQLQRLP